MANIYLSPHLDDICFSLGGYLLSGNKGWMINIYSRSYFRKYSLFHRIINKIINTKASEVSQLRMNEDGRFLKSSHSIATYLKLWDITRFNIKSTNIEKLEQDIADLNKLLIPILLKFATAKPGIKHQLFCPIGIGGHRNHMAVRYSILQNLKLLMKNFEVIFYEDLPYASDLVVRNQGIDNFLGDLSGYKLENNKFIVSPETLLKKNQSIDFYKSQNDFFIDYKKYIFYSSDSNIFYESTWKIIY